MKRATELFARGNKAPTANDAQRVIDDLHRKIGQLQSRCCVSLEGGAAQLVKFGALDHKGHLKPGR
jgi:hypothetical protein